jgi:Lrp/AsnC family transcriptional regulator, regulator for asnA, asnC and gidA
MSEIYQLDELDRGILNALMDNARTPYAELAKVFTVSPGTIHVRVEKMKQAGIITGAHIRREPQATRLRRLLLYRHHFERAPRTIRRR